MSTKKKPTPKASNAKNIRPETVNKINVIGSIAFYLFAFCLLWIYNGNLLFRLQELSVFLPTSDFLSGFMTKPGGFLFYISCFLLQFFYYPWLGSLIYISLLVLVQYLIYKNFPIDKQYFFVSLIPSALLLLSFTQLDYIIYMMRSQEIVYTQVLGFLFVLAVFCFYRRISISWIKICISFVCGLVFYPLLGFYALLALLLIGVYELIISKRKNSAVFSLGCLILIIGIPLLYYFGVYDILNIKYIYLYGLPLFNFLDTGMWIIACLTLLTPFLFLLFYNFSKKSIELSTKSVFLNILILFFIILGVTVFTYKDKNFHIQLKMERAIGKGDFDKVLDIAEATKDVVPTRVIVQYRNIALYNKGLLLDKMFVYPHGSAPYESATEISATSISAYPIFYYYGRLNFSYRWAMESVVKRGLAVDYLKYMAKVALFNKEYELAGKYISTLKKTLFYKGWAKKYEVFLEDQELFKEEEEYKKIRPLMVYQEVPWEDTNNVEACNLNFYSTLLTGTQEMFEFSVASALTAKNIKAFLPRFETYLRINKDKPVPIHLQEAAIMFGDLENYDLSHVNFDQRVINRYNNFNHLATATEGVINEETTKRFKERFADTYWYYYFFVKNMKTN